MKHEVLAIRHVYFEDLGNLELVLGDRGHLVRYLDVGRARIDAPNPLDPSLMVVLGGPIGAYEEASYPHLAPLLAMLEKRIAAGLPTIGICLGSQLIARAAGARVFRAAEPEVGWLEVELTESGSGDPVAAALPQRFDAFQWHHYTHDLPQGAVELARSPVCTQAFRLGRAWGVQFHPEVRGDQVESWLAEDPDDVADPAALRAATRERIEDWNELGRRLCSAFLRAV